MVGVTPKPSNNNSAPESGNTEPIVCKNCVEPVGPVHIECAQCKEDTVELCLMCFSCGAECGGHVRTHEYHVRSTGGPCLFSGCAADESDDGHDWPHVWCANEEIALLETVERYNLGNWEDVGPKVNPSRSVREVKEHYDRFYLRGRLGRVCSRGFGRPKVTEHTYTVVAKKDSITSPPIRQTVMKLSADDLRLLAYMPLRDDFEKEWNNDAEELVSKLLLMPDDDDLDKSVKLSLIDMYMRIVRQRRKRKALARDYDLVTSFFKQEKPALAIKAFQYTPQQYAQIKVDRELRESLRPFSQFLSYDQFEQLIAGIQKEKLLKQRVEELQKYRKNGVTTLEEGDLFAQLQGARNEETGATTMSLNANASSSWKLQSKNGEERKDSTSAILTEEPTTSGTGSDVGKRNSVRDKEAQHLLSQNEIKWCLDHKLCVNDFVQLKLCVLREQQTKAQGVPQRTNLRQDTLEYKAAVKQLMLDNRWMPLFS